MAEKHVRPAWYAIPRDLKVSREEYRANIDGINIVFGAVLGFVLADSARMQDFDFAYLLLVSATTVTLILYLSHSYYKLFYGVAAIAAVAALPLVLDALGIAILPKLQPTLGVWVLMVILIEIMPRVSRNKELDEGTP